VTNTPTKTKKTIAYGTINDKQEFTQIKCSQHNNNCPEMLIELEII